MDPAAHRHESSAAALNPWIMPRQTRQPSRNRRHQTWRVSLLALGPLAAGCKPSTKPAEKSPPALTTAPISPPVLTEDRDLLEQLTAARLDAVKSKQEQHHPHEALALLVSALHADPASGETRAMAESILKETV